MVSDFQCPWCKKWHDETYPALKKEYVDAGKVRVAYLNYPMQMHVNARPAALAAMCAAAQGKFWATHDRIFLMQGAWEKLPDPRPYLDSLAIASGADAARQRACSSSGKLYALIDADYARAQQTGVRGTPVFFVGGRRIDGAEPIGLFRTVIDSVLKAGAKGK
jgi:protein-disulfide isomerase